MKLLVSVVLFVCLAAVFGQRRVQPGGRPIQQASRPVPPPRRPGSPPPQTQGFNTFDLPDGAEFVVGQIRAGFTCDGRRYGYYADVGNNCHLFHVCMPVKDENGFTNSLQYSFFCGNQTLFNQELMTCDHAENVDCSRSEFFYNLNDEFGVIPRKF